MDEFEFENSYEITKEMYLDWATHPVGELAKKRARTVLAMTIVELVISLALAAVGVFTVQPLYVVVGLLFALYFVANVTILRRLKYTKQFKELLKQHNADRWPRVMRFGDRVSVEDAGKATVFDWDRIVTVTQDDNWVFLWVDPSSAYRVKKDAFTKGNAVKFTAFVGNRLKKK